MKADQERVSKLLTDTVTLLCKNGLIYKDEIKIQGLLGITLDRNDVFIVHINETIGSGSAKDGASDGTGKKGPQPGVPVVDLTRVADTPAMPSSVRAMGPLVPGMSQQIPGGSGAGNGGINARKQRPPMPQMMPRGQYMPMPRFRMGMSPASMHAMASTMNNHMMYSRQPGGLAAMSQMRQRLPVAPHLVAPSRRQQMQPPTTVSIDDDEDVVIIGTGHEEPSPNWNSPVRRNHQGRSAGQQLQHPSTSSSQAKSASSISLSSATPVSSVDNADVDQLQMTVALDVNASAEPNITEISLSQLSTDGSQPSLVSFINEGIVEGQSASVEIAPVTSAMLIEPNDQDSDVDSANPGGESIVRKKSACEKPLCKAAAVEGSISNEITSSEIEIANSKVVADQPTEATLLLPEGADNTGKDGADVLSQDCSKTLLADREQPSGKNQHSLLPVVYTDIADGPESLQFEGVQVTDMDIQTLGFDILTEDDHEVGHSSSQLASWNCKLSSCNASFGEASSLASHYTLHHTDLLDLLNPCAASLATDSSASEGSERGSTDGTGRRKLLKVMHCPFAGCPNKFSSWPGLNLHHKNVHRAPISKTQREQILALCGKPFKCAFAPVCQKSYLTKRELCKHVMKVHDSPDGTDNINIPGGSISNTLNTFVTSEPSAPVQIESVPSVIKNFLCLVSNCEVVCGSREALIEHLKTCHENACVPDKSSVEVKEETVEDQ